MDGVGVRVAKLSLRRKRRIAIDIGPRVIEIPRGGDGLNLASILSPIVALLLRRHAEELSELLSRVQLRVHERARVFEESLQHCRAGK